MDSKNSTVSHGADSKNNTENHGADANSQEFQQTSLDKSATDDASGQVAADKITSLSEPVKNEDDTADDAGNSSAFECPVCLQNATFPVQLPCSHIFCFLCVKGVANRSKRCALCRQVIPAEFFNAPKLVHVEELKDKSTTIFDEGYQWFYEGRNGWWQYDERTSLELESRYKKGEKNFELLIAGFLYAIDLENMRQYRRNDQTRRRRIRRDLRSIPDIKGIAGLKFDESQNARPRGDGDEDDTQSSNTNAVANQQASVSRPIRMRSPNSDQISSLGDDTYLAPPAPNNTPQTPQTPADSPPGSVSSSEQDLSIHLQNLQLQDGSPPRVTADQTIPSNLSPDNSDTEQDK